MCLSSNAAINAICNILKFSLLSNSKNNDARNIVGNERTFDLGKKKKKISFHSGVVDRLRAKMHREFA